MGKQILNGIVYGTGEIIKFSPCIYSLEEREIGVWIDGKPLYQKSFECSVNISSSWVNTNITLENVDRLIHCYGGNKWGSSSNETAVYNIMADMTSNNKIELCIPGWNASVKYFTLLYTKTTDTPGSGKWTTQGTLAHHYSTEEQVIGTWLGETLYEKTIDCGALPNNDTKNVNHNIANLKRIVDFSGSAYRSVGDIVNIPLPYVGNNSNLNIVLYVSSTSIGIATFSDRSNFTESYVTIQYTKTTDTVQNT